MNRIKTPHQQRVEDFMVKVEQCVPSRPGIPPESVRRLRAKLILEEALETITALGFTALSISSLRDQELHIDNIVFQETHKGPDLVEIADGCADLSVVTIGTLSACGIADDALLTLIDESNSAKIGPGGYKREDGKWIKPPDWVAPDINGLLAKQTEEMK